MHSGANILLIEDHEDTARAVAHILQTAGHRVSLAFTIGDALSLLVRESFDVIVSDLSLPDGTGIKLIHGIRGFCKTPAIALTGYAEPEDAQRCLEAGFDRHLAKPLNFAELLSSINELAGGKFEGSLPADPEPDRIQRTYFRISYSSPDDSMEYFENEDSKLGKYASPSIVRLTSVR